MKTKIGERSRKPKIKGLKGFVKAYPGAAILAGLVLVGGLGVGAMGMIGNNEDEIVLEQDTAVVDEVGNKTGDTAEKQEQKEVTAKSLEESVEEIVDAGAVSAEFSATEEGMTVSVVLSEEASAEDVEELDSVIRELVSDTAFLQVNLFENSDKSEIKAYEVNYMLGEAEEASYISTAAFSSGESRKGGMLYYSQTAWSGPKAVEVEEESTETTTPATTPAEGTTGTATTTPNDTTTQTQTQTGTTAETPAQSTTTTTTPSQPAMTEEEIKASVKGMAAKAKQYKTNINGDIIGWLNIPGTGIDYPVTHTNNNSYYMNHNIYKQSDRNGALLADYECNFNNGLPTNTVIYGHNWNNYQGDIADNNPKDIMFDEVHKYADATFAKNHPYIYFSTTSKDYKYQVFAAFYTHVNWTDYLYTYPNATRMQNIISTAKNSSLHNFGVNVSTSDKIISLSTCTRMKGNTNQYRFVVMAKLVG